MDNCVLSSGPPCPRAKASLPPLLQVGLWRPTPFDVSHQPTAQLSASGTFRRVYDHATLDALSPSAAFERSGCARRLVMRCRSTCPLVWLALAADHPRAVHLLSRAALWGGKVGAPMIKRL
jgi:hypothetical protein